MKNKIALFLLISLLGASTLPLNAMSKTKLTMKTLGAVAETGLGLTALYLGWNSFKSGNQLVDITFMHTTNPGKDFLQTVNRNEPNYGNGGLSFFTLSTAITAMNNSYTLGCLSSLFGAYHTFKGFSSLWKYGKEWKIRLIG